MDVITSGVFRSQLSGVMGHISQFLTEKGLAINTALALQVLKVV